MNRGRGGSRRPNRGGGRHNLKPRSVNRTVLPSELEKQEDLEDDNDYGDVSKPRDLLPVKERDMMPKTKRRSKAPIQKLQMSIENQEMIKEVLHDLQLSQSGHEDQKSLVSSVKQARINEAYWKKFGDNKLLIEGGVSNADNRDGESQIDEEIYSSHAVKKLQQCGFERIRCTEALKESEGDLGAALEFLICSCCGLSCLGKTNPDYSDEKFQEASSHRQEEAVALESIYNDAFTEVIADNVWTIKLSLPFLLDKFKHESRKENSGKSKAGKKAETAADICRFFLQGYCKFGDKCRLKHILCEEGTSSKEAMNKSERKNKSLESEDLSFPFHLEVRFCKGSLYPFEPPMVVFYSTHESVPSSGCLNVTLRLNREAKELCDAESPVVFCLASLLEDEDEILACFNVPPSEYSLPLKKSISIHSAKEYHRDFPTRKKVADEKSETTQPKTSTDKVSIHEKSRKLKEQFQRLQVTFLILRVELNVSVGIK